MVDVEVRVCEHVAKADPGGHAIGQGVIDDALLREHPNRIPVRGRLPVPLVGNDVVRDVDHVLARQVQEPLGQVVQTGLAQELVA